MASGKARISVYNKKAKKPSLLWPRSTTWHNKLDQLYIEWMYNGADQQSRYEVQIASDELFSNCVTYTGQENKTKIFLSESPSSGTCIRFSGTYYWRVRVCGTQRVTASDWSSVGKINIDMEAPQTLGIDIVSVEGVKNGALGAVETHSNLNLVDINQGRLGFFFGSDTYYLSVLIVSNNSEKLRTFFGKITFMDLDDADLSSGNPVIQPEKNDSYGLYWSVQERTASFAVVLDKNQKFKIRHLNYGRTNCEFHVVESNLYPTNDFSSYPSNFNALQLLGPEIKNMIKIGGAETPPTTFSEDTFDFTLNTPQQILAPPFGKANYIDRTVDNGINRRVNTDSFTTEYDVSNIKAGDSVWFQRSYDSYSQTPRSKSSLLSASSFAENVTREWFRVLSVDPMQKRLTLEGEFKNGYANVRYPYASIHEPETLLTLPPLSTASVYTKTVDTVHYDDGTSKTRTLTTVSDPNGKFETGVVLPDPEAASEPVGANGLSSRWIGMRVRNTTQQFQFYPICRSAENTLTVLGDIQSDLNGQGVVEPLEYYITGDTFIITNAVFCGDLSNTRLYVGASDGNGSGVSKYGLIKATHKIVNTTDVNGFSSEYLDRILPQFKPENVQWQDFPHDGFVDIDVEDLQSDEIQELFVVVKDLSGNISHISTSSMPSTLYRLQSFSSIVTDTEAPNGRFYINGNEKHLSTINAVIDTFPIKENYALNYYYVSNYNPLYFTNKRSKPIQEMGGPVVTWHKWSLGNKYTYKLAEILEQRNRFAKIRILSDQSSGDLTHVRNDVIGTMLSFPEYPALPLCPIVDVLKNGSHYDTLVIAGSLPSDIKANTPIVIDTTLSSPSGSFSDGGLHAIYYADTFVGTDQIQFSDPSKIIAIKNDSKIDFASNSFGSELNLPDYFSARWIGWFWSDYDTQYTLHVTGIGNAVRIDTEDARGMTNILPETPLIPTDGSTPIQTKSRSFKAKRGWNRLKVDYLGLPNAKLELSYRSSIIDDIYQKSENGETEWILPQIVAVDEQTNSIRLKSEDGTYFSAYRPNELQGKHALVGILDAKTATDTLQLSDAHFTNIFQNPPIYDGGNTVVNVNSINSQNSGEDTRTLSIQGEWPLYFQVVGDYPIYPVNVSAYPTGEATFNYILLNGNHVAQIAELGASDYRLGRGKLEVESNTEDSITFARPVTGAWSSVMRVGTTLVLTDSSQKWSTGQLEGLPIVVDCSQRTKTMCYVKSNTETAVSVYAPSIDTETIVGKQFRIGSVVDVAADVESSSYYFYVPVGQPETVIPKENLVRNAAKAYVQAFDYFGFSEVFMEAVSLLGISAGSKSAISGSVIEYDLDTNQYRKIDVGTDVFDANEVEEIVGVYESEPISAPTGFLSWKTISFDQHTPTNTSIEFYIRTAETEDLLNSVSYNVDAFGTAYPAFTSASFDMPYENPNALNISKWTTDGNRDSSGRTKKNRWIQFKYVLKSSEAYTSPKLDNIRITYTTAKEQVICTKNITLESNILGGILSANCEIPDNTEIVWGINTSDETDFNTYQVIYPDEAFEVLEPNKQFRLSAKLISSDNASPEILNMGFSFYTQDDMELPNKNL